jgi:membrane-bound acyltransferase YfiQ involved in biofilm formation
MIGIIICYILILHYVGDWLLQTRKIAEGKSSSITILSHHVTLYTLTIFVGIIVPLLLLGASTDTMHLLTQWIFLNGVLHWITDYFTSKMTKKYYTSGNMKKFWHTVGLDQLIHAVTLIMTLMYINQIFR